MTQSSFIFVRHGQSQANADSVIANAHSPLTQTGIEQARATAHEVKHLDITQIACSPYLRAQQTAQAIATELGLDIDSIQTIEDLRERGLGIHQNQPRIHEGIWYFTDDTSKGIELRADLLKRMTHCAQQIKNLGTDKKTLVVGHAISGFYLTQVLSGHATLDQFDPPELMSNAAYVELPYPA